MSIWTGYRAPEPTHTLRIYVHVITPDDLAVEPTSVYILMGPTGSGKSAFIQSLSPHTLSISKDSLDSVTQDVICYRVSTEWIELTRKRDGTTKKRDPPGKFRNSVLLDTPGFLDTKMSESRVTRMITERLDAITRSAGHIDVHLLYFLPITDNRTSGSKKYSIKILKGFAKSFNAKHINVVTTMWNMVFTPAQTKIARRRFDSMKRDIFRKSGGCKIELMEFTFTIDSAWFILSHTSSGWELEDDVKTQTHDDDDYEYQWLVTDNLLERIINTYKHFRSLADDIEDATKFGIINFPLLESIRLQQEVDLTNLRSFLDDLYKKNPQACSSLFLARPSPLLSNTSPVVDLTTRDNLVTSLPTSNSKHYTVQS